MGRVLTEVQSGRAGIPAVDEGAPESPISARMDGWKWFSLRLAQVRLGRA